MTRPSSRLSRVVAVALGVGLVAAPLTAGSSATADEGRPRGADDRRRPAVVVVDTRHGHGAVPRGMLGINHRFGKNAYGLWNAHRNRPDRTVVRHMRRSGVQSLRFPGGTTATMYHWKGGIGPVRKRTCQVEGHGNRVEGFKGLHKQLAYGVDEFMQVIKATGANPLVMMPFVTQTPSDAADFVEYVNDPRGGRNPGGGVAWARKRAKLGDHPKPYGIHRWEVGNEAHVAPWRYDFSTDTTRALHQYAGGGVRKMVDEKLGRKCSHPGSGKPATGKKHQVFEVLYNPVARFGAVKVNGHRWHQVAAKRLRDPVRYHTGGDKVYAVAKGRGQVIFGTKQTGLRPRQQPDVPRRGATVSASYTNTYQGFFSFARKMHQVDRSIKVCASWGTPQFAHTYGGQRRYDCSSAHPLTNFSRAPAIEWQGALEGHDRMMLGLDHRNADVKAILRAQPRRTPLWVTEFQPIHGYGRAFPGWSASVSNSVYMASQWATWLKAGIPWANGGDLLGRGVGSVFGQPDRAVFSVEAWSRRVMLPMFSGGGKVLRTDVRRNPHRSPHLRSAGTYSALTVAATRARGGKVYLLVVNKLPNQRVRTEVRIRGFAVRRKAATRAIVGDSFREYNKPGRRADVRMRTDHRGIGRHSFRLKVPAHSVTLFRMHRR